MTLSNYLRHKSLIGRDYVFVKMIPEPGLGPVISVSSIDNGGEKFKVFRDRVQHGRKELVGERCERYKSIAHAVPGELFRVRVFGIVGSGARRVKKNHVTITKYGYVSVTSWFVNNIAKDFRLSIEFHKPSGIVYIFNDQDHVNTFEITSHNGSLRCMVAKSYFDSVGFDYSKTTKSRMMIENGIKKFVISERKKIEKHIDV